MVLFEGNAPGTEYCSRLATAKTTSSNELQKTFNDDDCYTNVCANQREKHHGLRTPREEIVFTARPKTQSQSQIFRYGGSIFSLPHWPNFSDIFDLYCHRVSVVRAQNVQKKVFENSFFHTKN